MTRRAVLTLVGLVFAVSVVGGASAAPSSFDLVFDGSHNAQLLHQGSFTTSSPLCSSGHATDEAVDEQTMTAMRTFRCDSSGASFTARISPLPAEHGGSGSWRIVSGTGALADLRGQGTWTSARTGGDPADPGTITFRSTWTGTADLDSTPPMIGISSASAKRLAVPIGTYVLRVALSLSDAGGGQVSYRLNIVDPRRPVDLLASRSGNTSATTLSYQLRVRPAKRTRMLQLKLEATDGVGNKASSIRTLRIG